MGDLAEARVSVWQGEEARFGTPWGEGCVVVAGGCPREVRLPCDVGSAGCDVEPELVEQPAVSKSGRRGRSDTRRAEAWAAQLEAYFKGQRRGWNVWEIDMVGLGFSPFQTAVYSALLSVPPGSTVSYARLAEMAGHPGAARAVGTAMARNPLPVIIPCHRVVRGDGALGQYGSGGPLWKQRLLDLEGRNAGCI